MKLLRIAIAGCTACSGCQLTLLNCEDQLPHLLELIEFSYFPMACSPALLEKTYDAALVEGCLSNTEEIVFVKELRQRSRYLIAIGACAVHGGVAALANQGNRKAAWQRVYGEQTAPKTAILPQPLDTVVSIDASVYGCPPEKDDILTLLSGLVHGVLPVTIDYPVCNECKMRENLCLLTELGDLCLGPLTRGGCNALCPSSRVACEGCRGPLPEANLSEALKQYQFKGYTSQQVLARLHRFCPEWKL